MGIEIRTFLWVPNTGRLWWGAKNHPKQLLWFFQELKRWKSKSRSKSQGATNTIPKRGITTLPQRNNIRKNHNFLHCRKTGISCCWSSAAVYQEVVNSTPICFEGSCSTQPYLLDHAEKKGLSSLHKEAEMVPLQPFNLTQTLKPPVIVTELLYAHS